MTDTQTTTQATPDPPNQQPKSGLGFLKIFLVVIVLGGAGLLGFRLYQEVTAPFQQLDRVGKQLEETLQDGTQQLNQDYEAGKQVLGEKIEEGSTILKEQIDIEVELDRQDVEELKQDIKDEASSLADEIQRKLRELENAERDADIQQDN